MADNVGYTPGTGATVAADDIGGVLFQRVKVTTGADGVANDVSDANPMPVTGVLNNNDDASASKMLLVGGRTSGGIAKVFEANGSGHLNISDGGGSITVDAVSLPLPTGAATETTLAALNTKIPALGQALMASSQPVVLASDQSAVPVTLTSTPGSALQVEDSTAWNMLNRIYNMLIAPLGYDKSLQRQRSTAVIESGTVTTVSTVTTVTTVTGLTNIDGRNGSMLINQTNLSAWADCVRAHIT